MRLSLFKTLGEITVIAISATMLHVTPAAARPTPAAESEPDAPPALIMVTAKSNKPNHFNSSIKVDIPGGGTAQVTSPSLDKNMTKAKVEVGAPLSDQPGFKTMAMIMFQLSTPGQRLVACLVMTARTLETLEDAAGDDYAAVQANAPTKALAIISYCLRLSQLVAQVIAEGRQGAPRLAAGGCPVLPIGVKTKTEQVNGEYVISADGPLTIKKKNSRLKVKCVTTATGYSYTVTPRKKGKTLKSIVGPNLMLGIASPAGGSGAKVKVSFKAP